MKCLWWDFIMAPTAWRGAITAGKHDEMFLSTLPPRLSLTRRQHSGRLMKCFRRGCSGRTLCGRRHCVRRLSAAASLFSKPGQFFRAGQEPSLNIY